MNAVSRQKNITSGSQFVKQCAQTMRRSALYPIPHEIISQSRQRRPIDATFTQYQFVPPAKSVRAFKHVQSPISDALPGEITTSAMDVYSWFGGSGFIQRHLAGKAGAVGAAQKVDLIVAGAAPTQQQLGAKGRQGRA